MSKMILAEKIILFELIGFGIVILFLWVDEIFDIPHHIFGSETTPINLTECIFETTIVLFFCVIIILFTLALLARVKHIEGFFPICPNCKKVKVENDWISIDDYVREYSEGEFAESLCPECTTQHRRSIIADDKKTFN